MPVESFNASVYLLDRQVEAGRGGHLAVTGPAGSLTYAELAQRVAELSSGLRAFGVRPEERVLLVTSDRPHPQQRQEGDHGLGAVGGDERHPLLGPHPERPQAGR